MGRASFIERVDTSKSRPFAATAWKSSGAEALPQQFHAPKNTARTARGDLTRTARLTLRILCSSRAIPATKTDTGSGICRLISAARPGSTVLIQAPLDNCLPTR
eukprot:839223-Amphidinium_carterae.1